MWGSKLLQNIHFWSNYHLTEGNLVLNWTLYEQNQIYHYKQDVCDVYVCLPWCVWYGAGGLPGSLEGREENTALLYNLRSELH